MFASSILINRHGKESDDHDDDNNNHHNQNNQKNKAQRLRDGLDLGVDRLAMSEFETCYLFPRNMLDDATGWIAHLGRRGIVDG
ncbi:hypothetical protein AK812_SmicGene5780 [Symbiodinium microadriaticum]|uniref:Uncharacterized protein n=1 Tax=Symbiodinium microadriaticum TaxID=2951 RepID=A0A1Q9ESW2_SYMMI|nr:hypothetical protein AK812_SmicGene5780 [Symbiodinium microadriaticum]